MSPAPGLSVWSKDSLFILISWRSGSYKASKSLMHVINYPAGLDKSSVWTPGTTINRCWATSYEGMVARQTTKISCCIF